METAEPDPSPSLGPNESTSETTREVPASVTSTEEETTAAGNQERTANISTPGVHFEEVLEPRSSATPLQASGGNPPISGEIMSQDVEGTPFDDIESQSPPPQGTNSPASPGLAKSSFSAAASSVDAPNDEIQEDPQRDSKTTKPPINRHDSNQGSVITPQDTSSKKERKFIGRFLEDVDHIKKLLKTENIGDQMRLKLLKPKEALDPVLNTFMMKRIIEHDGELFLQATVIQRAFGLWPDADMDPKIQERGFRPSTVELTAEEVDTPFKYRFNGESPKEEEQELRRAEFYSIPFEGRKISVSRFTFDAKIPLEVECVFDQYPFTAFRAKATIELATRSDVGGKNLRFRPNLILDAIDQRNNVCIQASKKLKGYKDKTKEPPENEVIKATKKKLDGSGTYDLISPYPTVEFDRPEGKSTCNKFSVDFHLHIWAFPVFIRTHFPVMLVATLNTINFVIGRMENRDNKRNGSSMSGPDESTENFTISASDRYLQTSVAIALAAVFMVPEISHRRFVSSALTWNDVNVLWIFISLILSSIPPSFEETIPFIGAILLWLSLLVPLYTLQKYWRVWQERKKQQERVTKDHKTHPFVQTASSQKLKENKDIFVRLSYCDEYEIIMSKGKVKRPSILKY